jgi:hypothetical protein
MRTSGTTPLVLGPVSNGEFLPLAARPADVRLARAVLDRAAVAADALAMDRRLFLQTAGGMAALLATINLAACSGQAHPPARGSARPATPGGRYRTPPPEQLPECQAALGSRGEFIVDVHTHHVMPSLPWRTTAPATLRLVLDMVPPDCTAANPLTCVDRAAYLHDVFLAEQQRLGRPGHGVAEPAGRPGAGRARAGQAALATGRGPGPVGYR